MAVNTKENKQKKTQEATKVDTKLEVPMNIAQRAMEQAIQAPKVEHQEQAAPLPFTNAERDLARYDGGSEVDVLVEEQARGTQLSVAQTIFREDEDPDAWRRPNVPLRDRDGKEQTAGDPETPRPSVYGKRLDEFAVSQCPSY